MNTTTYATVSPSPLRAWLNAVGAELRNAMELLGRPYVNGQLPSY